MLKNTKGLFLYTRSLNEQNQRLLSVVSAEVKESFKEPKKKIRINQKVFQYFNSQERHEALKYPDNFFTLKQGRMPDSFYIANQYAAEKILKVIKNDLPKNKLIFENSPGIGLLTNLLINETENDLFLYEGDQQLYNTMNNSLDTYNDRKVILKQCDFTSLWKLSYTDEIEGTTNLDKIFNDIQRRKYNDDTVARLFSCVGTKKFFNDLIKSVIFQKGMFFVGRIEMFLCLPPSVFFAIASSPSAEPLLYTPMSILFQLLFEYEFISKLNRKYFLPWRTKTPKSNTKMGKVMNKDFELMYLIRAEPRRDLFKFCLPEYLPALWFFVKQYLSKKSSIISTMEKLSPGYTSILTGLRKSYDEPEVLFANKEISSKINFIAPSTTLTTNHFVKDIDDSTDFRMLKPTQILSVFNEFINFPEYKNSPFVDELEKALKDFHINSEDDEESEYSRKMRKVQLSNKGFQIY